MVDIQEGNSDKHSYFNQEKIMSPGSQTQLRYRVFSGVRWTTVSAATITIINIMQMVILARILEPRDFGLVSMSMIVVGFIKMYSDVGLSAAIIHYREISRNVLSSLYLITYLVGSILFALGFLAAPAIAAFFKEPELISLVRFASVMFLIIPVGQQFQILLQKEMLFGKLAGIEVAAVSVGMIISVWAALSGMGPYSLIVGQLISVLVLAIGVVIVGKKLFRPFLHFNHRDLRGFFGFGLYQLGEKSINFLSSRIDQLLIGFFIGATELGYYTIAMNLILVPISRINPIINRVTFPALAEIQNNINRLKRGYLKTIQMLAFINFPLLIGLAVVASPFIEVVYGPGWEPAVPVLRVLALVGLLRVAGNPLGALILAKGRADLGFKWNSAFAITLFPVLLLTVNYGIMVVAGSLLAVLSVFFVFQHRYLIKPLIGNCATEVYYSAFGLPLFYAALVGATAAIALSLLPFETLINLILSILAGVVVYLWSMIYFRPELVTQFKVLFKLADH